jgi:hypothetical protein
MFNRKVINTERQERWRREDAAPRLATEVPSLRSLRLRLKDIRGESRIQGTERTQHVVVLRAGALFEIPCSEPKCQDGGYDVTADILRALRAHRVEFEGSMQCRGIVGNNDCQCSLMFVGQAGYAPS